MAKKSGGTLFVQTISYWVTFYLTPKNDRGGGGQRARLLLWRSEFESHLSLQFISVKIMFEMWENKQKRGRRWPIFFKKMNDVVLQVYLVFGRNCNLLWHKIAIGLILIVCIRPKYWTYNLVIWSPWWVACKSHCLSDQSEMYWRRLKENNTRIIFAESLSVQKK